MAKVGLTSAPVLDNDRYMAVMSNTPPRSPKRAGDRQQDKAAKAHATAKANSMPDQGEQLAAFDLRCLTHDSLYAGRG